MKVEVSTNPLRSLWEKGGPLHGNSRRKCQMFYTRLGPNRSLGILALLAFCVYFLSGTVKQQPAKKSTFGEVKEVPTIPRDEQDNIHPLLADPARMAPVERLQIDKVTLPVDPARSQPAIVESADGNCPPHSPGRLPVSNIQGRRACYGGTQLEGKRICDRHKPDFTQRLTPGIDWLSYEVREQTYLVHPFYHTSQATLQYRGKGADAERARHAHVSLATQGSWNRLDYIQPLAKRWNGPVSVALLLDSEDQLPILDSTISGNTLMQHFVDIHVVVRLPKQIADVPGCGDELSPTEKEELEAEGVDDISSVRSWRGQYLYNCRATCVGYGEPSTDCPKQHVFCPGRDFMGSYRAQADALKTAINAPNQRHPNCPVKDKHYPVNMLRNVALQNIATSWVMVLDIDNIPSSCMLTFAKSVAVAEQAVKSLPADHSTSTCPGLYAFIPPAIEMSRDALNRLQIDEKNHCEHLDRMEAVGALMSGAAQPMHMYFPPAYVPTNHLHWMKLEKSAMYEVQYTIRFEPYYVARTPIPMFSDDFVDRGGNFAQQVLEMYSGGYRFFVLPDVFAVDIPHSSNGPSQTEDNQRLSNALWRAFYLSMPQRYGVANQPYKGPWYVDMRRALDKMVSDFQAAVQQQDT